jgi:hypothetical protein
MVVISKQRSCCNGLAATPHNRVSTDPFAYKTLLPIAV